ncbi:uncharacterized protein LAJ45_01045 [Morchella importuna]|uniref:uncharacterized protein n=1 Tax=Morchella importuna TaxID=1174673 RepID=UPI001E8EEEB3|nr:uncharacterized protein LAJ45_01045 [Morchella importuna]KAH8154517.1 hypothetical protein LAJ45_01045 [Morchella importuna]
MCIYTINEYPFCSDPNIYVGPEDATMCEGNGNQMCRKYSFTACANFTRTGHPCVNHRSERKYRHAIEAREDTIIRVHLTDCNMRVDINMGCKVGNGKRSTDHFNNPITVDGVPNIGPQRCPIDGVDGQILMQLIRERERN